MKRTVKVEIEVNPVLETFCSDHCFWLLGGGLHCCLFDMNLEPRENSRSRERCPECLKQDEQIAALKTEMETWRAVNSNTCDLKYILSLEADNARQAEEIGRLKGKLEEFVYVESHGEDAIKQSEEISDTKRKRMNEFGHDSEIWQGRNIDIKRKDEFFREYQERHHDDLDLTDRGVLHNESIREMAKRNDEISSLKRLFTEWEKLVIDAGSGALANLDWLILLQSLKSRTEKVVGESK